MSQSLSSWEPEPTRRGTFSIAVACLTTLGFGVWSALHLNIPAEQLCWKNNALRKLLWVCIGILLPEYLIGAALDQLLTALDIRDQVNRHLGFPVFHSIWYQRLFQPSPSKTDQGVITELGLTPFHHTASLVATKIEFDSDEQHRIGVKNALEKTSPRKHPWTTTHGFYVAMGGFAIGEQSLSGNVISQVISPSAFLDLLQRKPELFVELLPDVSEEALYDRGKSDGLAKLVFLAQVGWFFVTCIGRLALHLPFTLLEVSTIAHTLCALSAYALWWKKPLNVTTPTILSLPESTNVVPRPESFLGMEAEITENVDKIRGIRVAIPSTLVGFLYGVPIGLIWNVKFATGVEELLWRISASAAIAASCSRIALTPPPPENLSGRQAGGKRIAAAYLVACSAILCLCARLYLLAASWRQLFYLPPGAFITPVWSGYFPYIS